MNRRTKTIVAAVMVVAAAGAVAVPMFLRARGESQRNACLNNLRFMDCVLYCCNPRSENLAEGDMMDPKTCFQYLKGGTMPVCRAGGEYIVSYVVGGPGPKCTIHGGLQDGDKDRLHPGVRRKGETEEEYGRRMELLQEETEAQPEPAR
jgi:hypothetical protein